jgi:hypothetical protein
MEQGPRGNMKEYSVVVHCDNAEALREALEYTNNYMRMFPAMFAHMNVDDYVEVLQEHEGGATVTVHRPA